jgi:hypothetical protein
MEVHAAAQVSVLNKSEEGWQIVKAGRALLFNRIWWGMKGGPKKDEGALLQLPCLRS